MEKFFGGPVLPTLLKLAVASVIVGLMLAVLGIEPLDLWEDFLGTIARIWDMGFDVIDWAARYLLIGAVVVIPIWIVVRLWSLMEQRRKS